MADDNWTFRCPNGHLAFERTEHDRRVRGCSVFDCEYRLEALVDVPNIEAVFQAIPITLNVGTSPQDWGEIVGWANGWKDLESGTVTIVMSLDSEASQRLGDMTELFKLYSLGFAAIKRTPE